tara:strand:+ start:3659 stop:4741 length:1083 start_codon:yes stop_codon:yes gene_type:complete
MDQLGLENFYKSKRILITGNTGFKGAWLSLWLNDLGAIIKGYSLAPPTQPNLFSITNQNTAYETILGDIRDYQKLYETIENFQPEIIFHLAAQSLVKYSYENPLETFETNIMGTANLLEAAKCSNALRVIINVTSDKCYENNETGKSFKEEDRLGGLDPYSSSKACAELVSNSYSHSYFQNGKVNLATVRAGNVIGGGDWAQDRLIPDIYRSISKKQKLTLRNPNATRPWQHVLEPLSGYLLLGKVLFEEKEIIKNNNWNFGPYDSEIKPVEFIVNAFTALNPKITFEIKSTPQHEHQVLKLDISKVKMYLKWQPKWTIEQTIERIHNWFECYNSDENMQEYCISEINEYTKVQFKKSLQ